MVPLSIFTTLAWLDEDEPANRCWKFYSEGWYKTVILLDIEDFFPGGRCQVTAPGSTFSCESSNLSSKHIEFPLNNLCFLSEESSTLRDQYETTNHRKSCAVHNVDNPVTRALQQTREVYSAFKVAR